MFFYEQNVVEHLLKQTSQNNYESYRRRALRTRRRREVTKATLATALLASLALGPAARAKTTSRIGAWIRKLGETYWPKALTLWLPRVRVSWHRLGPAAAPPSTPKPTPKPLWRSLQPLRLPMGLRGRGAAGAAE